MRKELLSPESFEEAVGEEIEISSYFYLPMCACVLRCPDDLEPDLIRRLLDDLRFADLAAITAPGELAMVFPNTSRQTARAVTERLLLTAPPGSTLRSTDHEPDDTPSTLLERARLGEAF